MKNIIVNPQTYAIYIKYNILYISSNQFYDYEDGMKKIIYPKKLRDRFIRDCDSNFINFELVVDIVNWYLETEG